MDVSIRFKCTNFIPLFLCFTLGITEIQNGKYTRQIETYSLTVPHKLTQSGVFLTFKVPHYFEHQFTGTKKKRSIDETKEDDENIIKYGLVLDDKNYVVTLRPNHDFLAADAVTENRSPNVPVKDKVIRKITGKRLCHFVGSVDGVPGSRAALTTCKGLAGYVLVNNKRYFIEPLEEHQANRLGQHLHIVYERDAKSKRKGTDAMCGSKKHSWEQDWKNALMRKYTETKHFVSKRGLSSVQRYLELLVVCDKKFIKYHKFHDIETYVLTIINMVSDFYHDPSSGNAMDIVVVRIIYLEKQEDEIDLMIVDNADDTLASFCKWQQRINPKDVKNPNHHDIAVLLTRHDLCGENATKCGLEGLAYVGTPCTTEQPCAINEDSGLILAITLAHELGHVMGCSHDSPDESGCQPKDPKDDSNYVMAPTVSLYTIRWSSCSRTFITTLFESDLGECLNDEPQVSLYKQTNVLPGVVYDAQAQCEIVFPGSKTENFDPENFCKIMFCATTPDAVQSLGAPYVDGTKCGENKWCFHMKCIEMGQRPEAVNGGWSKWNQPSSCSRTCGGGVTTSTRECNNPIPANGGRYCLGERKKVQTCNMQFSALSPR